MMYYRIIPTLKVQTAHYVLPGLNQHLSPEKLSVASGCGKGLIVPIRGRYKRFSGKIANDRYSCSLIILDEMSLSSIETLFNPSQRDVGF